MYHTVTNIYLISIRDSFDIHVTQSASSTLTLLLEQLQRYIQIHGNGKCMKSPRGKRGTAIKCKLNKSQVGMAPLSEFSVYE